MFSFGHVVFVAQDKLECKAPTLTPPLGTRLIKSNVGRAVHASRDPMDSSNRI